MKTSPGEQKLRKFFASRLTFQEIKEKFQAANK